MPKPHVLLVALIVFLVAGGFPAPSCGSKCKEKCGKMDILYPFYLKDYTNCTDGKPVCGLSGFELDCDNTTTFVSLGSQHAYEVLELRAGEMRINPLLSNSCTENNLVSFQLADTPFRLSPHNMLQLYSCNRTCQNCSIPLPQSKSIPLPLTCPSSQQPCCESLDLSFFYNSSNYPTCDFTGGFQSLQNYSTYYRCASFTSWAYASTDSTLSFHADYGLKLEWFIKGSCSCSPNAVCIQVLRGGHTCKCKEHYVGDGYAGGIGCHSENAAQKWVAKSRSSVLNAVLTSGVIIAALILGVAMVIGVVLFKRRKDTLSLSRGALCASYRREDINGLDVLLSGMEVFAYKELEKATKGFSTSEKLGYGACGAVFGAKLEDGRRVAVKRLHHFNTQLGYQQTLNEISVLSAVKHRNLVRLLGCCVESSDPLLVFEFVSNGTLAEHLQRERGDGLDWFTRLTVAVETADALAYLHTLDPPILHRDVKSRNILLDHDFNTKVADFGLSRMGPSPSCDGSHISTIPQGTPGYLDPEYHQNFHLSDKSDVYSFGVVLIEIITALKPVDFSREKKEVNLAALAVAKIGGGCLDDIIDASLQVYKRPNVKAMVQRVAELAFRCLAYDKDARPPMVEVLEELVLIRGSATSPLVDAAEDIESEPSAWMDAQSSQQQDSDSFFSLSSLETDRFLLVKPQPVSPTGSSVQACREKKDSS